MKHLTVVIFSILLLTLPAFSQQTWTRTYGGAGDEYGYSVQQTTDGGYIIAGYTTSFGNGNGDVYLIKSDASGDTLWTRSYGGVNDDYGYSVQQTSDGGYIITGYTVTYYPQTVALYLIKTNAAGDTLWTKTYGGDANDILGYSVQQTSDGGYIIGGAIRYWGAQICHVLLLKTNGSGDTLWTKSYGGVRNDYGYSVQQTSDGGYIIAGVTYSFGSGDPDVYLIKTDSSGNTRWTRCFGGPRYELGNSVQQTSDGCYIIAGYTNSFGAGGQDVWLIKTDSCGKRIWTNTYGGGDHDYGYSVQQTTDGGYIIAGSTMSFGAGIYDVYLIKTDLFGNTIWTKTYGGSDWDEGYSVQQTSDGGYIITGYTDLFRNNRQVYLIKTDAHGNVGIETPVRQLGGSTVGQLRITPNPFTSFARVPGHEGERFNLYDIAGRKVGTYKGDRIGEGLGPGVYFLTPEGKNVKPIRIVKLR